MYYSIFFAVLYRLLADALATPLHYATFAIVLAIMLFNASWSFIFFRRKDVRMSFLTLLPYAILVIVLTAVLLRRCCR